MRRTGENSPIYLTVRDVATRWHVGLSTVYQLKDRRLLPYHLIAGCIRFRLEDIEAYEQAGRIEGIMLPARLRARRSGC